MSDNLVSFGNCNLDDYYRSFYDDPSVVDGGVSNLIKYATEMRKKYDILPYPDKIQMPQEIQDRINEHTVQTSRDEKVMNEFADIIAWEKFVLSDEQIYTANVGKHSNLEEVLNDRMNFNEMKRAERNNEGSLPICGRQSVNIKVGIRHDVLKPVLDSIDPLLIPTEDDNKKSLIEKTSKSSTLDELNSYYPAPRRKSKARWHWTRNGKLTRQNASGWTQARRRSMSIVKERVHVYNGDDGEGQGRSVISLFNYTSFGRHPDDWRGRPMRNFMFNFVLHIWMVTWPYLTVQSRRQPPTHVQTLYYYSLLKSHINDHRDNFSNKDIERIMNGEKCSESGHPSAGADNSQIVGSNVLVYTEGNLPQTFTLHHPSREKYLEPREKYEVKPSYQFQCGRGTVSVLDPVDDLLFNSRG